VQWLDDLRAAPEVLAAARDRLAQYEALVERMVEPMQRDATKVSRLRDAQRTVACALAEMAEGNHSAQARGEMAARADFLEDVLRRVDEVAS
jgi:hypothetical protein